MQNISDEEFEKIVAESLDSIPPEFGEAMQNTVVTIQDEPNPEQRSRLRLCNGQTLLGLFEGIPKTMANNPHATIPPNKITIFKLPLLHTSGGDLDRLKRNTKHTVWHEVAHYFGLNHGDIQRIERKHGII